MCRYRGNGAARGGCRARVAKVGTLAALVGIRRAVMAADVTTAATLDVTESATNGTGSDVGRSTTTTSAAAAAETAAIGVALALLIVVTVAVFIRP